MFAKFTVTTAIAMEAQRRRSKAYDEKHIMFWSSARASLSPSPSPYRSLSLMNTIIYHYNRLQNCLLCSTGKKGICVVCSERRDASRVIPLTNDRKWGTNNKPRNDSVDKNRPNQCNASGASAALLAPTAAVMHSFSRWNKAEWIEQNNGETPNPFSSSNSCMPSGSKCRLGNATLNIHTQMPNDFRVPTFVTHPFRMSAWAFCPPFKYCVSVCHVYCWNNGKSLLFLLFVPKRRVFSVSLSSIDHIFLPSFGGQPAHFPSTADDSIAQKPLITPPVTAGAVQRKGCKSSRMSIFSYGCLLLSF